MVLLSKALACVFHHHSCIPGLWIDSVNVENLTCAASVMEMSPDLNVPSPCDWHIVVTMTQLCSDVGGIAVCLMGVIKRRGIVGREREREREWEREVAAES